VSRLFDRASHCGFNGGIIEKSSGHFLIALVVDPLFSPANGPFFISTRQRRACRGLLSIAFDRARHSASNGLNIVDFGPFIIVFDGYVGKYYVTLQPRRLGIQFVLVKVFRSKSISNLY
jgi:hypothetical protein